MLRALVSYQCGPGSVCGLSLLLVLVFFLGSPIFLPPNSSLEDKGLHESSKVGSLPDMTKFF